MSAAYRRVKRMRILATHRGGDGVVRCAYCGTSVPDERATLDHWVPRVRGGVNAATNLVAACEPCNSTKAAMTGNEFCAWLYGAAGRRWFAQRERSAIVLRRAQHRKKQVRA